MPRSRVGVYLGKSREHERSVSYVLNLKTRNISPQYHCVYNNDFTTVHTTKDADKIKLWSSLYKAQPDERSLVNHLYVMKNTFDIQSPQLKVMDVANSKPSSGKFSLVEAPQTSKNHRALRQQQREKRTPCSAQNMNTTPYTEHTYKSKRLTTSAQTNSLRDSEHSNKVTHSDNYNDINISEGADGIYVEDTITTPFEGAPIAAQFIDRNANKDFGNMKPSTMDSLKYSRKKPNTTSKSGRKRSIKTIDITIKDTNRKRKTLYTKDLKRDRGTPKQKILKRKRKQKKFCCND